MASSQPVCSIGGFFCLQNHELFRLGEALVFAVLVCLFPVWVYLVPQKIAAFIIINGILLMLISILAGWDSKRIDVVLFSPVFVLLQTLDLFILLGSFWKTVVRGKHDHAWN